SGIWIFPEGTRSRLDTADLLPFKKGAFHLAIQAQLPILPIVAEGYSHIYDSARRSFPGGELEIRVLEPIPTIGMTADNVNELVERTRNVMLQHLKEMDTHTHGTPEASKSLASSEATSTTSTGKTSATSVGLDEAVKKRKTLKD
ncbi:1-acylglycerol-3-phosphate O-acyltransferase, partial [Podila verticillata]